MIFTRGYKINKLYVSRLARVTKEEAVKKNFFCEREICYHTEFDGPACIFTIRGNVAKRLTTGVKYYFFDGTIMPRKGEWYVKGATPLSQLFKFGEGETSISLKKIKKLEKIMNNENCKSDEPQQG